jgi:hypothetical protein
MRETNYWVRIIVEIIDENSKWFNLEKESKELMKILGTIYTKTSKK